jgi:predicted NBD/HSP70 family sugar kinase
MIYFAGLDVSVKETSVCVVNDAGKIVREARVASEPEALLQVLTNTIASSELDWKPVRSGFTAFSPKRACR